MKNFTKKTMILGLMAALLIPFSAMSQRGNGGGNNGNRGGNTPPRHKPKPSPQKQKPHYRYDQHRRPHQRYDRHRKPQYRHRNVPIHRRPHYRKQTRPMHRGPRHGRYNFRPMGMHVVVYNNLHTSLNRASFDRDRLEIAKLAIANNGATTSQVINLMNRLSFDGNRLELAKFAFDFVIDPEQYFRVVDNLTFYSNRRNLLNYIQ